MQVGDLVRFRCQPDPATGVILDIDKFGRVWIAWSFLDGRTGYQNADQVEVISANR